MLKHYEARNLATIIFFDQEELDKLKPVLMARIDAASASGSLARTPLLELVVLRAQSSAAG